MTDPSREPSRKVILEVRRITAQYGERTVLKDVSFQVFEGEILVIIGASGSGKTTVLKHMVGLLCPSEGEILYRGQDITKMDEDELSRMQRTVGIAFQFGGLINSMTVGDNVALPLLEYGGMDETLANAIARLKLSLVGLAAERDKLPDELSGGMLKRAGLARAIALDPPLVYFDEPSAGLDPIMAAGLDELILDLRKMLGITFVIVTHELESIRKIADRAVMLDRGTIIFSGTVEEAERSEIPRVKQFFARRPDEFIGQRSY